MKIIYICAAYIHDFRIFIAQVKRYRLVFRLGTGLGQFAWVYAKGTNLNFMTAAELIINYTPGSVEAFDDLVSTRELMMNTPYFDNKTLFDTLEDELLNAGFKFVVLGNCRFWYVNQVNID